MKNNKKSKNTEELINELGRLESEQKKIENKMRYLNELLKIIRTVNQLIIRETDEELLLRKASEILVGVKNYTSVCLLYENRAFLSGDEKEHEKLLGFVRKTKKEKINSYPFNNSYISIFSVAKKNVHVSFSVVHLKKLGEMETELMKEITGDISFGLHSMKIEEKRREAEKALQKVYKYAESIVETVREPLIVLDSDIRVISANRSFYRVFKLSPDQIRGKYIYEIGNGEWNIPKLQQLLEDILLKNTFFDDFEIEHISPDVGKRVMLLNARRIYSRGEKTEMILLAIEDITERKRIEEQRENARKEAEFYADILLHDMGNINQVILWSLYLIRKERDEEARNRSIDKAIKAVNKSKGLIESIKILKMIKNTKIEKYDLNSSIERAIEQIRRCSDKKIEVKFIADRRYHVKANNFLDKVFFNILENSVEYTFQKDVIINIKIEEKDSFCNVSIRDYGLGISKKKREDILKSLESLSKRTGIGLYLTKKILDRFNGKFDIKDVEKGTEIFLSIPSVK